MAHRMQLKDRTAVITGAGSGIGRAIAGSLVRRGCNLALVDIDPGGLEETASLVQTSGIRISNHTVDVADREAIASLPPAIWSRHGGADLLINNAGVALAGTFEQVTEEQFEWLIDINFGGMVRMTRAFLPLLRQSPDGRIVNLSSVFGIIAPPGQAAYAASKFAVRGFSEALRHELKGSNVSVTVVHPGGVATSIADKARIAPTISSEEIEEMRAWSRRALRLQPQAAGEAIVRGIERRANRVLIGSDAILVSAIARLMPVSYWKLLEAAFGRPAPRSNRQRA
ncbi:MAG: SDR family NAD(P)-dependent oxidoreductase [Silvibacterium sp.]|nr:SDR family NAD(P)-dependent oxidoreductase [Silvibacterium sp.]